jgi:hypothetical protein
MNIPIDQMNNHHPFCLELLLQSDTVWTCQCELLREYDEWAQGSTAYDKGLEDGMKRKVDN